MRTWPPPGSRPRKIQAMHVNPKFDSLRREEDKDA
jgi:hypothetical protein